MSRSLERLAMVAIAGAAFVLGAFLPRSYLDAQGRGPSIPPPPNRPEPPPSTAGKPEPVVYAEENGQACAANGFLAVTGSYGVGTSVLYLVDTVSRQLSVYEARGGSQEQRRIVLVGARKIDLDLQLEGYNDRSEYDYRQLRRLFERRGEKEDITTGLEKSK
jgi:hypothetical protein